MIKIFDIKDKKVVINVNVLLIPALKDVVEASGMPGLNYVYYMTDLLSPYNNMEEEAKIIRILEDHPGDYTSDDLEIVTAIEWLQEKLFTPRRRLYRGLEKKVIELGDVMYNEPLNMDKEEGNYNEVMKMFDKAEKVLDSFNKAEKSVEKEVQARGDQRIPWDLSN